MDMEMPKSPPRIDRGGYIVAGGKEGDQAMPDEQPTELAAKIVGAYVRRNQVPPDQLAALISTVHQALGGLGKPAIEPVVERTPAVSIRRSVHRDYVICLDCGWRGQMLRRHVTTAHGLSVEQYRARWNLPADHAMTAPGYSERRSTMAKQIGLGRGGRGHRSKRRNRRHPKARRRHRGGEDDPGQQRRQRKGNLTSDQGDDFPLSFGVGLDVSGGRPQAGMTGKLLNVAQAAADLADFPGRAGDETSPAGMR